MTAQKDTRTATQKIADTEQALMALYQTADNMARDLTTMKEAIKLLGNKVDSIVKASAAGETLSDEVISRIMIENNVEELTQRTQNLVAQGILVKSEQVGETSFVVGSELDDKDTVVNPRMQFALQALTPALQEKIRGSKVGDVLTLQEGKLRFKVLETYDVQTPTEQAEAMQESEATAEATAAETATTTETAEAPAANA